MVIGSGTLLPNQDVVGARCGSEGDAERAAVEVVAESSRQVAGERDSDAELGGRSSVAVGEDVYTPASERVQRVRDVPQPGVFAVTECAAGGARRPGTVRGCWFRSWRRCRTGRRFPWSKRFLF